VRGPGKGSLAYFEILGALLCCATVSGSIYSIFVRQERARQVGIELAEATQNARAGIDLLSDELQDAADSTGIGAIRTASQFRVTFALDRDLDRVIEPGETVTYFLDANRGDRDYVLRRKVGTVDDPSATPVPGTGEIVAYGLTQRSTSKAAAPDVPLFSYRSAAGETLELKPGTLEDRAGRFYGRTVSDGDRIQSIEVTLVTETREKNPASGSQDRVRLAVSIGPATAH